jgi:hypothetical protein
MRIETWCLGAAVAVAAQIVLLSSVSGANVVVFNFLAYAALTLLLWIATHGRRHVVVPAGVMLLGACVQGLAVAVPAVILTAGTLFFLQGKPVCAASSRQ